MFIIRTVFWLSLVIAFIPVNPGDLEDGQRVVSTRETIGAVQSTYSDLSQFCHRNTGTCETGRELFSQFGAKAKTGAQMLYSYIDDSFGDEVATEKLPDPVETGATIR